jgi:hypothetical protein
MALSSQMNEYCCTTETFLCKAHETYLDNWGTLNLSNRPEDQADQLFQKGVTEMPETKMPHEKHEQHLCYLQNLGYVQSNLEEYKELVRDAKHVCKNCGRTAAKENSLCKPEKL